MNSVVKALSISAVVAAVALALMPQHSSAAPNQAQQVLVVNAAAQAVPVTGNVAAAQSGAWSVGINGTPSMTIGNLPSAPVPTQNVDEYGRQPFQFSTSLLIEQGNRNSTGGFFTVPAGKRLVIEHVSARLFLPTGQLPEVGLGTVNELFATVVADKTGAWDTTFDRWGVTRQVLFYMEPGSDHFVYFSRNSSTGLLSGDITISGHYINQQ